MRLHVQLVEVGNYFNRKGMTGKCELKRTYYQSRVFNEETQDKEFGVERKAEKRNGAERISFKTLNHEESTCCLKQTKINQS